MRPVHRVGWVWACSARGFPELALVSSGVNQLEECRFCNNPILTGEPRGACMCAEFAFVRGAEWRYVVQTDLTVV